MATTEEKAIAAINAAEALAISNIQLIRELKAIIPKPFDKLVDAGMETNTAGVRVVADAERKAVRKTSRASRAASKKLSKALREANRRLRTKSGKLRKGKTQKDVMRLAQRLRKKM